MRLRLATPTSTSLLRVCWRHYCLIKWGSEVLTALVTLGYVIDVSYTATTRRDTNLLKYMIRRKRFEGRGIDACP